MASRAVTGVRYAPQYTEASVLEVLQGEICRTFENDVAEKVGQEIGFKFATRFPIGPAPFAVPLDQLKFLCKEVWTELYGKKVDRLQTNHRGTFMCTDVAFPPLTRLRGANQTDILRFLAIHKGMIRGILTSLGVNVFEVTAQIIDNSGTTGAAENLGCCFVVRTVVPA